jgi:hypothetical protein
MGESPGRGWRFRRHAEHAVLSSEEGVSGGLASSAMSVPVACGWPMSGSVRDDTVSADGLVPVTAPGGCLLAFMVSFRLMPVI